MFSRTNELILFIFILCNHWCYLYENVSIGRKWYVYIMMTEYHVLFCDQLISVFFFRIFFLTQIPVLPEPQPFLSKRKESGAGREITQVMHFKRWLVSPQQMTGSRLSISGLGYTGRCWYLHFSALNNNNPRLMKTISHSSL